LPRSRLQRAGHDDDPVRHGRPERHEPLPPVHRGPPAGAGRACAEAGRGLPGHARAAPALRARSLRGHARGARPDVVRGGSVPPLRILSPTTGSSSLKFALYELGERQGALATGAVERIGDPGARLSLRKGADAEVERTVDVPDGRAAIETALAALDPHELPAPDPVRHRVAPGAPAP